MNILATENLKKYYGSGQTQVKALDGVTFSVKSGTFTAIVGTSGSGKSTLLHMLGGLDTPTSGRVIVGGRDLSGMTKDELTIFRRRNIGFIFQAFHLIGHGREKIRNARRAFRRPAAESRAGKGAGGKACDYSCR